jgi:hypothetical protein
MSVHAHEAAASDVVCNEDALRICVIPALTI